MKIKKISVELPDFCSMLCEEFRINEGIVHREEGRVCFRAYTCKNEAVCRTNKEFEDDMQRLRERGLVDE